MNIKYFIVVVFTLLVSCTKAPESALVNEPTVSGSSILFPKQSPTVQRLLTAPVVVAQDDVLNLPGRIVWDEDHTSRIMPPVSGRLDAVEKSGLLGSFVQAHQTLAYLTSPELGSAQSESAHAQALLKQSEQNFSRIKELFSINGVSAKEFEQAQADVDSARAEAGRTELKLKLLGSGANVDQRFSVRSSIAGVVVERNTNPGMEWRPDQAGAAMFVVSDPTYLWCWIDAPEQVLDSLHNGMKVLVHASAWPQEIFTAQIDYVGDALDPVSRTIKVRAHLRNPKRHLKGEMFVTAELKIQAHGVLDVPTKAVYLHDNEQQVFVKTSEGLYTRKTIVPVTENDEWTSIAQGLNKDDEVVVDGALYLEKMLEEASQQAESKIVSQSSPATKPHAS